MVGCIESAKQGWHNHIQTYIIELLRCRGGMLSNSLFESMKEVEYG